MRFYTRNGWAGKNYEKVKNLTTTEIAKLIRKDLKKEFENVKFSVRTKSFSSGSEIIVSVMEAPFDIVLREREWKDGRFVYVDFKGYAQINEHQLDNENNFNNGYILSEDGRKLLKRVVEIVNSYRFNDSNAQMDYFHTNFYTFLEVGRYDKKFKKTKKENEGKVQLWRNGLMIGLVSFKEAEKLVREQGFKWVNGKVGVTND